LSKTPANEKGLRAKADFSPKVIRIARKFIKAPKLSSSVVHPARAVAGSVVITVIQQYMDENYGGGGKFIIIYNISN